MLLRIGVDQWFYLDEWDYLTDRTASSFDDLMRPHNEHWNALPILLYRAVYRLFGLTTYVPYRAMAVGSYLGAAVVLRLLLRRVDVGPWLATAVVVPFVLFGPAWQNITWGFQVGWNLAMTLPVVHLLLADHDGPWDWRDALGLLVGFIGLTCGGVAVPLVAVGALALLLRRGWRTALLHSVPLGAVYLLWSSRYGDTTFLDSSLTTEKADFVWTGLSGSVTSLTGSDWLAMVALAITVAGIAVGIRADRAGTLNRLALAGSLALGAVAYLLVVASGRAFRGAEAARSSRYLSVVAFLLLPLFAVALQALIEWCRERTWPHLATGAAVLGSAVIWIGLPGNVSVFSRVSEDRVIHQGQPELVRALADVIESRPDLPDYGRPLPTTASEMTVGWVRGAVAEGRLDPVPADDPIATAIIEKSLLLVQVDQEPNKRSCQPLTGRKTLALEPGDQIGLVGLLFDVTLHTVDRGDHEATFNTGFGSTLEATAPVSIEISNPVDAINARICVGSISADG